MGVTKDIRDAVEAELENVRTWAERDAAVGGAWMVGGVMQVRDDHDIVG